MSDDAFVSLGDAAAVVVDKADRRRAFEKIAITDRDQWLALRRQDVTASAVGALFGVSEYVTPRALWELKSGLREEPKDVNIIDEYSITLSPMARGTLLEDRAEILLRELRPKWKIWKCEHYYRDPDVRLGATPDLMVEDESGALGVVQVKNPHPDNFRRKWKSEDGSIEPPINYAVQALTEAHLTGAQFAMVAAFVADHATKLQLIPVDLNERLIDAIREKVVEFWRRVAERDPYDFDYARDGAILARLYGNDNGSTIDLSSWNEASEIAEEDARLAALIKESEERRKALKNEVIAKMGEAAVAMVHGRVFATAKTQHRKGYEVKPTSFRVVRMKA